MSFVEGRKKRKNFTGFFGYDFFFYSSTTQPHDTERISCETVLFDVSIATRGCMWLDACSPSSLSVSVSASRSRCYWGRKKISRRNQHWFPVCSRSYLQHSTSAPPVRKVRTAFVQWNHVTYMNADWLLHLQERSEQFQSVTLYLCSLWWLEREEKYVWREKFPRVFGAKRLKYLRAPGVAVFSESNLCFMCLCFCSGASACGAETTVKMEDEHCHTERGETRHRQITL